MQGRTVAIVGDIANSRVARSTTHALVALGAHVIVIGPPALVPPGFGRLANGPGTITISHDLDSIINEIDAIMMLRVQQERMNDLFFPNTREYSRYFGLNADRLKLMSHDSIVMHPGPMNRGLEITAEVADSARSVIVEQVANGVSVRMAILYVLLAGRPLESGGK